MPEDRRRAVSLSDTEVEELARLATKAQGLQTMRARVDFIRNVLGRRGAIIWIIPVAVMNPGLVAEGALRRKARDWLGNEGLITPEQRALPHNTGGAVSHGSIVACEYGLPAVGGRRCHYAADGRAARTGRRAKRTGGLAGCQA